MRLVTGGAGFIGSHLVDSLAAAGGRVRVLDDLSTGRRAFLQEALATGRVEFQKGDVFRAGDVSRALRGVDEVYHFAADPDVRAGILRPWRNFRDGAVATFRVLEAMRRADARRFVFASSSTVYGEATRRPTPEDYGPCLPISPYGASKLAAEGLVAAYAGTYGLRAWIYRFGNVVGPRLTHGVVADFGAALRKDPTRLRVLGDGQQEKAYLSVEDCVSGIRRGVDAGRERIHVFNLASGTTLRVTRIAEIVVEAFGLHDVRFAFTGGERGWAGDVPRMDLTIDRIAELGWRPKHSSEDAVRRAAESFAGSLAGPMARARRRSR